MRFPTWLAALAIAGLSPGAAGQAAAASVTPAPVAEAAPVADKATIAAVTACTPGGPCAHRLPVRVVVVTMFEVGKDSGDAPGEFQFWKERRGLNTRIAFPQSHHDLYYNPATGVLGMVTGMGSIRAATATLSRP